ENERSEAVQPPGEEEVPAENNTTNRALPAEIAAIEENMVYVSGGSFTMGCTSEQRDCRDDEKPAHLVSLNSYYISKYEVTQNQWESVMGTGIVEQRDKEDSSYPLSGEGADHPMYYVNWGDAQIFLQKLNAATGENYRLPTEAEWEYAARGGSKSEGTQYSGSNSIGKVGWYKNNSEGKTHPVGQKSANELGLYDMTGNVAEWCEDWYGDDYYIDSPTHNPKGPSSGENHVLRGGAWPVFERNCRLILHTGYGDSRSYAVGFRLVISSPSEVERQAEADRAEEERRQRVAEATRKQEAESRRKRVIADIEKNMVYVEGGTFTMGCTSEQADCDDNEKPTHRVGLSSYYISKYEVTQAQWNSVMERNSTDNEDCPTCPVAGVSWNNIQEFLQKLNARTEVNYRLPTEAEWEYAARGGSKSRGYQYSGSNSLSSVAWYGGNSGDRTHPIGSKSANELGLYDMTGNVFELCQDWYGESYYSGNPSNNPMGPSSGFERVFRGGSFYNSINNRVTNRAGVDPKVGFFFIGFRLASSSP
ncbi:MAG: SUMF1/EgtB/PvdO family nonheme iron enzyme, partial [Cyclobacteriaceae bacterium]|nr:SUMF1/EgtB/PvdO family nonheme iron enzyme [Cyclobacteriaceae bacterium]